MKLKLIVLSAAILLIAGCQKDNSTDRNDPVILETDPSVLNERMSSSKAGIIFLDNSLPNKQLQASIRANTTTFGTTTAQVNLTLIKEILPPVIKGQLVRVTHVAVAGNYAYVSYNREGETYLGGIDVIDIRDKNNPVLVSSAGLPNMDISSLAVEGNNLYFVGAADVETIQGITSPAISGLLPLNGGLPSSNYSLNALPGQVATDFTLDAGYKYVVTGSNGIISKIDKNSEAVVKSTAITGLLSVRTNANHVIALSADKGLFVFDKDLNEIKGIQTITNDVESKRNIEIYNNYVLVSEGTSGLGIYDLSSGELFQRIAVPSQSSAFPNVDPNELTTIAVSVNNGRMYIANGAAGISIYKFNVQNNPIYVGSANLNILGESSSNYILSKDDYVFVAGGKGGLKILKVTNIQPAEPVCAGTFPKYTGNLEYDLNVNTAASYADEKVFKSSVNINQAFNWCGILEVKNGVNVNGGLFDMNGSLIINKFLNINRGMKVVGSALIGGDVNINGGAELSILGNLSQGESGKNTTFTVNGNLKVDGEVVIYGNLIINGSGIVEFANNTSKLTVYGNLTNSGKVHNGSITKI